MLAGAGLFLVGCSTPLSKPCHYEYKTIGVYFDAELDEQLNAAAKEGWRVVSAAGRLAPEVKGSKVIVILERCKP